MFLCESNHVVNITKKYDTWYYGTILILDTIIADITKRTVLKKWPYLDNLHIFIHAISCYV